MLRKITSFGSRGHQILGLNVRSCQTSALTSNQHEGYLRKTECLHKQSKSDANCQLAHQITLPHGGLNNANNCNNELKHAQNLISKLFHERRHSSERNWLIKVLEFCCKRDGKASKQNYGDRIYLWCTGVLAISSVLLFKNWLTGENRKNLGLKEGICLDAKTIRLAIKAHLFAIPRQHILLPVLGSPKKEIENEIVTPLDKATNQLRAKSDECTASIWNKAGLQMLNSGQEELAAELFKMASENGHLAAIYNMALCLEQGRGVTQDISKAVEFYEIAADRGHPRAQFNLASLYNEGFDGTEKDTLKATNLLEKAADNGVTKAQIFVGFQYAKKGNQTKAAKYFGKAAEDKDPVAMFNFAICLENGFGVKKDMVKAGQLYEEAAEQSHTAAMFNTAVFYEKGFGDFTKCHEKAIHWFEKAAQHGDKEALSKLNDLRRKYVSTSEGNHHSLNDFLLHRILNGRQQETVFHKSKSTPNLQRHANLDQNNDLSSHESRNALNSKPSEMAKKHSSCSAQMLNVTASFPDLSIELV